MNASMMKIGLIKENKIPADSRVVLTPKQVTRCREMFPAIEIAIQPSENRCYSDQEYIDVGCSLEEDLSDRDVLIGVKEVPIDDLVPNKTYFFFSHTIKKQPYNRELLKAVLKNGIRLIDYECLADDRGIRIIAFGRWAGIVGAHNGLYTFGKRTGQYHLKRAVDSVDYNDLTSQYDLINWPAIRIATTGSGRVARGSNELLRAAGIREVSAEEIMHSSFDSAVFTNLKCEHLYRRTSDDGFDLQDFFDQPAAYKSIFLPYCRQIDLFINSIYWDPAAPAYFSTADMQHPEFAIQVIADITCDIAPDASIPSTIRSSTIEEPVYGYDPRNREETPPFLPSSIDVMAIDNLPNELPRDASESFGEQFIEHVMPELVKEHSEILERATIALDGQLGGGYGYLADYVSG